MGLILKQHSVEEIKRALLEPPEISNVLCFTDKPDSGNYHKPAGYAGGQYRGIQYDVLATAVLTINDRKIRIAIGINDSWKFQLFDFYIVDYLEEFPFIPHIDGSGKVCFIDLEGILIDNKENYFSAILLQCVELVISVLRKGLSGVNQMDFIKEFHSYWGCLPDCKTAIAVLPIGQQASRIKYIFPKIKSKGHIKMWSPKVPDDCLSV